MVDLANVAGLVGRHVGKVRLYRGDEIGIEFGDEVIVGLLLGGVVENGPGQIVNIPCVVKVDVGEFQRNRSF